MIKTRDRKKSKKGAGEKGEGQLAAGNWLTASALMMMVFQNISIYFPGPIEFIIWVKVSPYLSIADCVAIVTIPNFCLSSGEK